MCSGDKIVQGIAQAVTAPLKRLLRRLPIGDVEPAKFQLLLDEIRNLRGQFIIRRVDHQSFGMGTESTVLKLLASLPEEAGFALVAGDSIVYYYHKKAAEGDEIPPNLLRFPRG